MVHSKCICYAFKSFQAPLNDSPKRNPHLQPFCVPRPCGFVCGGTGSWDHTAIPGNQDFCGGESKRGRAQPVDELKMTVIPRIDGPGAGFGRNIQLLIVRELTIGAKPWGSNEQWRWIWMFFFIFCCRANRRCVFLAVRNSLSEVGWSWKVWDFLHGDVTSRRFFWDEDEGEGTLWYQIT